MIEETTGDLLSADVDALVNTVNTVGVMGKGIALQFRKKFPDNFRAYERACRAGEVSLGRMFVFELKSLLRPSLIINFPTKEHWRARSRLHDIEAGLTSLVETIRQLGIKSLALPPLGCGNGGLEWQEVRPLIHAAFAAVPDVRVLLFVPAGAPSPHGMDIRTKRPQMTASGAAMLALMRNYAATGYELTLLEVQKLVYFLKVAGQPMNRVVFEKHTYGPYADALRHMLDRMDGHFISGYGDGSNRPETPVQIKPQAAEEADDFLRGDRETHLRFSRVAELIDGFETPYGMELLSTVHWVTTQMDAQAKDDVNRAIAAVHDWNDRKRQLFKPEHIEVAWDRLRQCGWFDSAKPTSHRA